MSPAHAAAADEGPGLLAGRYELGPVIGAGSSAVVHQGCDLISGAPVAVKILHPGASANDLRQHHQEMEALAKLTHPGLVALHGGGTEGGRHFVVTDLVEGSTLAQRIRGGPPLSPAAVRVLGTDLAEALAYVHARGFIHRDMKPANVLLDHAGRPKLADFGIARAVDGTSFTGSGYVVGTAAYLAPEQVRGEHVGPMADIYALGLVLLEALTGYREYPGLPAESATARLHRPPEIPEGLPGGLGALLEAMTDDEPARRPTAMSVAGTLAGGAPARRWAARAAASFLLRRVAAPSVAALFLLAVIIIGGAAWLPGGEVSPGDRTTAGPDGAAQGGPGAASVQAAVTDATGADAPLDPLAPPAGAASGPGVPELAGAGDAAASLPGSNPPAGTSAGAAPESATVPNPEVGTNVTPEAPAGGGANGANGANGAPATAAPGGVPAGPESDGDDAADAGADAGADADADADAGAGAGAGAANPDKKGKKNDHERNGRPNAGDDD